MNLFIKKIKAMENNTESENSVKNIFNDVNYFALKTDYTHRLINSDIIDRLIDNVIRPPEDYVHHNNCIYIGFRINERNTVDNFEEVYYPSHQKDFIKLIDEKIDLSGCILFRNTNYFSISKINNIIEYLSNEEYCANLNLLSVHNIDIHNILIENVSTKILKFRFDTESG